MSNAIVRLVGWPATVFFGDPCVFDRWRWLRRNLRAGPGRTLDAGSGSGAFTFYAASLGNEVVGISNDVRNNRVARERAKLLGLDARVTFLDADLRELGEYEDDLGKFDQVICSETIEHIADDRRAISDLADLLKPGGRLLVTTPSKYHRPYVGESAMEGDGAHVRYGYTHTELRDLFDQSGLDVVSEAYVSGVVSQQLANLMTIVSRLSKRVGWLAVLPLRSLQVLDRPVTALMGFPYLCVAVVGVRRESVRRDRDPDD